VARAHISGGRRNEAWTAKLGDAYDVTMGGAHRGPAASNPAAIARAGLLPALAIVGAVVLLGATVYGAYAAVAGTSLTSAAAQFCMWLALGGFSLFERPRARYWPWLLAAGLLASGGQLLTAFAGHRHWHASTVHTLGLLNDWLLLPAGACFVVAVVIGIRSTDFSWLRRRLRRSS
jgi:hypothetical protein